ncbi:hypothetical protein G6734_08705, partial [Polynucleobacter paneuropaeus]|nr:hypothetical protein [Polynucleobacter paneuropaeus]
TYLVAAGHSGSADVAIIAHDSAGNTTGYSATSTITIDTVAPSIIGVSANESSSNTNYLFAGVNDVITQFFTATDTVGSVTIDGHTASITHLGTSYTASYTVQSGDVNGPADVTINAYDAAGNTSALTISGGVTVNTQAPAITQISQTTNNPSAVYARANDVITDYFTATDTVLSVTIDTHSATSLTHSGMSYTASYTVQSGDINGPADVIVDAVNAVGNHNLKTLTSTITIDTVAPSVSLISELSTNTNHTLAKAGEQINVTFSDTDSVSLVTIGSHTVAAISDGNHHFTASYLVSSTDNASNTDITINAFDTAGNTSSATLAGAITIDTVAPSVSLISELSTNTNHTLAKAGEQINVTFSDTDSV